MILRSEVVPESEKMFTWVIKINYNIYTQNLCFESVIVKRFERWRRE